MINDLRLQHFRSYSDESFEFDASVNIIVGPNASGKTNLLEGLLVACLGSSYRARDVDLIQHRAHWGRVDVHSETVSRSVKLERQPGQTKLQKTFLIGNKPYKRLPLDKTLPVVLFEPNHLQLLTGSPELRRDFLDDLLEHTDAEFGVIRRQYQRTLKQRNALLKHGPSSHQALFVWDIRLSELGGMIVERRQRLLKTISRGLGHLYRQLSTSQAKVGVQYVGSCTLDNYATDLLKKLELHSKLDYQRGFTAYGPHRDDFVILLNRHPLTGVASRGEVRTFLLGLKILEMQILEDVRSIKPLLLLDDVFSELDGARRRALTEFLAGHQTFITTTDADVVIRHFMEECRIIPMS